VTVQKYSDLKRKRTIKSTISGRAIVASTEKLEEGRKACTHCGRCCQGEVCPVGEIFTRTVTPPCPALAKDEKGKFWCGLIVCPETAMFAETEYAKYWSRKIAEFIKSEIFNFGKGCDW